MVVKRRITWAVWIVFLGITGGVHCSPVDEGGAGEVASGEMMEPTAAAPAAEELSQTVATGTAPDVAAGEEMGSVSHTASAMRVYRDPDTGRIGPPPPGVEVPLNPGGEAAAAGLTVEAAASTSGEGLREEASPVPGGGTLVRLDGRFRSVMEAHVDDEGRVETDCEADDELAEESAGGEG